MNRVLLPVLLLLCTGCFYEYPIAEPSRAITDDAIVGLWRVPEGQDLTESEFVILALPRQQYLVTMVIDPEERNPQPPDEPCEHAITGWAVAQTQFLAYIVEVDGRRFLTLQTACGEAGYAFARYWIRGDTARFMTPGEEGDLDTPEAAARVPALLGDEYPDTIVAYRVQRRSLPVDWPDSQ